MRTKILLSLLCAQASLVGACKWTEFDDLESDTWVASVEKPSVDSSDYGIAIQRGADASESNSSGTLAVIGAAKPTYSELVFDGNGGSSLKSTNILKLVDQGITTLDPSPPLLLASPSSEIALVTTGDNSSIVVATGSHTLLVRQLFVQRTTLSPATVAAAPDAAIYMQPPVSPDVAGAAPPEPLVAAGDVVLGTVYNLPSTVNQPACKLTDGVATVQIRALGVVRNTAGADMGTDDVLMWNGGTGKLHRYTTAVFNGCGPGANPASLPTREPKASGTTAYVPGKGSQILTIDEHRVLLQGHDVAKDDASFLQVFDSDTLAPLGVAVTNGGLRSAAVLKVNASTFFVMAGYPSAAAETGGTKGGVVQVYKLGASGGFEATVPAATLHDAQPDANQQFGRAIATMPYNGKAVIAVAADNEIFVYFRANLNDGTPLYDETRQGR